MGGYLEDQFPLEASPCQVLCWEGGANSKNMTGPLSESVKGNPIIHDTPPPLLQMGVCSFEGTLVWLVEREHTERKTDTYSVHGYGLYCLKALVVHQGSMRVLACFEQGKLSMKGPGAGCCIADVKHMDSAGGCLFFGGLVAFNSTISGVRKQ